MSVGRIYSAAEAADKLHLKPITVKRYLAASIIRGTKIGGKWCVLEADLAAYIEERRKATLESQGQRGRPLK